MDFATAFTAAQEFLGWQLASPSPSGQFSSSASSPHTGATFNPATSRGHVLQYWAGRTTAAKRPAPSSSPPSSEGTRERFVMLEALAEKTQDEDELRNQLLHFLLAGRDTTASLLSWSFALLAHHPTIFASLRSSILSTFGFAEPQQQRTHHLQHPKILPPLNPVPL